MKVEFIGYFCGKRSTTMKKDSLVCLAFLLAPLGAMAADYNSYYRNLPVDMPVVTPPEIPQNSVNITEFGAIGDGVHLNTEAFERAIGELSRMGGGHLVVPAGIWLTGPISLRDDTDLHLEKNAIVMASPEKALFIGETNGKRNRKCTPLITAKDSRNVSITGEGTIDGNGAHWRPVKRYKVSDVEWKEYLSMGGTLSEDGKLWYPYDLKHWDDISESPERLESMRDHLIRLNNCENVLISGVTLQNSPKFHFVPNNCRNIIIDGITVHCPWNAQNGDAIDIGCSKNVLIVNNTIDAGDDGICMKGGVGAGNEPCENILITGNTVYHAHGGFVIGSEYCGGMRNIVVRGNRFSGTDTGLRFKSGIGRGGRTEGIYISDIYMTDIKDEAIVFECTYVDGKLGTGSENDAVAIPADAGFIPDFSDIHFSDITCRGCRTAVKARGLPGIRCIHDIYIDGSTFFYTGMDIDMDDGAELKVTNTRFVTFER